MSIELENSFDVPIPPDQAWDVLLDVARVAPCMPGATVDEVDGDVVTGRIKVKVGPITMTYSGKATFTDKDPQAHSLTMEAAGKETRGAGTASATVHARLDDNGGQTTVVVQTSLNITGKPAQFGRGVMSEVAARLIEKFSSNLAGQLAAGDGGQAAAGSSVAGAGEPADAVGSESPSLHNEASPDSRLAIPIQELNLSVRSFNTLKGEGIDTVGELVARTPDELLTFRNLGEKSVGEIEERLGDLGLALSEAPAAQATISGISPADTAALNGSGGPHADRTGASGTGASDTRASDAGASETGASETAAASGAADAPPRPAEGLPREGSDDDDDALNLLDVAAGPILKRAVPAAAVAAVLVFLGVRRYRARHRRIG